MLNPQNKLGIQIGLTKNDITLFLCAISAYEFPVELNCLYVRSNFANHRYCQLNSHFEMSC